MTWTHRRVWPFLLLSAACAADSERPAPSDAVEEAVTVPPRVVLETTEGQIVLELDPARAPETVENFLLHVRSKFYDGLLFHRVVAGFMIQAGQVSPDMVRRVSPVFPIANEAENGLLNVRGALAMARTSDPHSATSEFFINLVDNAALDFTEKTATGWGYAVFGRVVEGLEVVDAIGATPTTPRRGFEALPDDPIVIERAYIHPTDDS